MFGFGSFSHLLVVLVLALILLGPKQLPEVARTLGRLLNELRRASNIFTDEFRAQMRDEEHSRIIQPPAHSGTQPKVQTPNPAASVEPEQLDLQVLENHLENSGTDSKPETKKT